MASETVGMQIGGFQANRSATMHEWYMRCVRVCRFETDQSLSHHGNVQTYAMAPTPMQHPTTEQRTEQMATVGVAAVKGLSMIPSVP